MKKIFTAFFVFFVIFGATFLFFPFSKQTAKAKETSQVATLVYRNKNFKVDLKKYEVKSENFIIMRDSQKFSRNATLKEKINTIETFYKAGGNIEQAFRIVCPKIDVDAEKILKQINKPSVDAKISFNPYSETFSFTNENSGVIFEKENFYKTLLSALKNENKTANINVQIVSPKYTADMLKNAIYLRSSFVTEFKQSSENRKHNIKLALKRINGKKIMPKECFSFNKATGKRIKANGFSEAKTILKGVYVDDYGGGVCQVSTALYNAAILAGLDVPISRGHSFPASYVPAGLDAMVADNISDLVIKNTTSLPVFIKTEFLGDKACIKFFGENLNELEYIFASEIIEEYDEKAERIITDKNGDYLDKVKYIGEKFVLRESFKGFKTQSYLLAYRNGVLVSSKKIRTTKYESAGKLIIEGAIPR